MKTTTKKAPATKVSKATRTTVDNAAATPKKKKSGAQRRREAREREALLAQQPTTVASPVSILDTILDATIEAKRPAKPVDAPVVVTPAPAPAAPAFGPNGMPTLAGILDAKRRADEQKAAKKAKRAPKPKKDPKSYHVALSSLSRMNQRDLTWRAGDMVKRGKFGSFELAIASVLVNMSATTVDKYDGGTGGPIVEAPSVVAYLKTLDGGTLCAVTKTASPRAPRAAKKSADVNALAITFAVEMVDALGAKRAAKRLDGLLAKARREYTDASASNAGASPDRVVYLEVAKAEADRLVALKTV